MENQTAQLIQSENLSKKKKLKQKLSILSHTVSELFTLKVSCQHQHLGTHNGTQHFHKKENIYVGFTAFLSITWLATHQSGSRDTTKIKWAAQNCRHANHFKTVD